jgi:hypothetical protein
LNRLPPTHQNLSLRVSYSNILQHCYTSCRRRFMMDDNHDCEVTSSRPCEAVKNTPSVEVLKKESTDSIPEVFVSYDSDESLKESTACYEFSYKKRKRSRRLARRSFNSKQKENNTNNGSPTVKDETMKKSIAIQPSPDDESQCKFCENSPCILDKGLYDLLAGGGLLREEDGVEDDVQTINKQIRFDMYRKAARFIWGPLRKGDRRKLPHCVWLEIHDFVPEDDA